MGARKTGKLAPRMVAANLRAQQALDLRLASKDWPTIAKELGYAHAGGPYKAVASLLARLPAENASEFRQTELRRLERLREALYEFCPRDGDCLQAYLQVTDRIHRLLGMSQKVELTGRNGGPIQTHHTENVSINISFTGMSDDDLRSLDSLLGKVGINQGANPSGALQPIVN